LDKTSFDINFYHGFNKTDLYVNIYVDQKPESISELVVGTKVMTVSAQRSYVDNGQSIFEQVKTSVLK